MSEPTWPLTIRVPWDPARTGDNQMRRLHWREQARRRKSARAAGFRAWVTAGSPQVRRKVRLSVVVRRGVRCDTGNLIGGLKPLVDGVFVGWEERGKGGRFLAPGLLPDDSPEWLEWGEVRQETGRQHASAPEVLLVIEPAGEGETCG